MHHLHDDVCGQLDDLLMKHSIVVLYAPRREFEPRRRAVGGSRARSIAAGPNPKILVWSAGAPRVRAFLLTEQQRRRRVVASCSAPAMRLSEEFLDLAQKSAEDARRPSSENLQ